MKKLKSLFAAVCLGAALAARSVSAEVDAPVIPQKDGQTDWGVCIEEPVNIPFEAVYHHLYQHMKMERDDSDGKEGILMLEGRNVAETSAQQKEGHYRWGIIKVTAGKTMESALTYHVLYDRATFTHCVISEETYEGIKAKIPLETPPVDLTPNTPQP